MKHAFYAGVATLALSAGMASADGHLAFKPGEGPFSWDSYNAWAENAPDLSGQTVTIAGPWLQPEDGFFNNMLAYFEAATGADAIYTGSDSFEQQIVIDAEAGSAPNVAVFPQPGLAAVMASRGSCIRWQMTWPIGCAPTMPPVSPGWTWAPMQMPMAPIRCTASSTT